MWATAGNFTITQQYCLVIAVSSQTTEIVFSVSVFVKDSLVVSAIASGTAKNAIALQKLLCDGSCLKLYVA